MSLQATSEAWAVRGITPTEKLVLLKIADHVNEGGIAWPSIGRMVKDTGLSRSTVCAALDALEEGGFIERKRGGPKGMQPNQYRAKWFDCATSSTVELVRPPDQSSSTVGPQVVRQSDPNRKGTVRNGKGDTKARGTLEEFQAYARELGMTEGDGAFLRDHFEGNGWKNGRNPVKDWRASFRKWKAGGWLPSQKENSTGGLKADALRI